MTSFLFAADAAAKNQFGGPLDAIVFFAFLAAVIFVAFGVSRKSGEDSESYFLAGRGLKWRLIGFSLIAANISAEQFVGMSGQGADYIGLAVASYEWIAALSLIIVAFFFLPRFLKAGIYTIPEYLEHRYNKASRSIMSILMMIMLVAVNITVVTFAGAKAYAVFFDGMTLGGVPLNLEFFCWVIGIVAAGYIFAGGLKACAWADLLQGSALILAGCVVLYFSMKHLGAADPEMLALSVDPSQAKDAVAQLSNAGAWERFNILNESKLRMNLPSWDLILPVTALIFAIWIPNLYYWGLNQYIIQRTLGAKSLGEGQKGLVFAAFMKLIIPFIVIFPGMIAFNLFSGEMKATSAKAASQELARFDEAQKAGAIPDGGALFSFNRSFATVEPAKAQAMLELNAKAADLDLSALQATAVKEAMSSEDKLEATMTAMKKSVNPAKASFSATTIGGYDFDSAFPLLMSKVIPTGGFKGFMLAALLGAIISSVAAMLNAASTIFSMDIYNEYFASKKLDEAARQKRLVLVGRIAVVVFVLIGCIVAPMWANPKFGGVFKAIQEFQGYISPGIFAAFVVGFWMKKAPSAYGPVALLACPVLYYGLAKFAPGLDFLNRMAVTFAVLIAVAYIMRLVAPRKEAFEQAVDEDKAEFLKESKVAKIFGIAVVVITVILYVVYWDGQSAMF